MTSKTKRFRQENEKQIKQIWEIFPKFSLVSLATYLSFTNTGMFARKNASAENSPGITANVNYCLKIESFFEFHCGELMSSSFVSLHQPNRNKAKRICKLQQILKTYEASIILRGLLLWTVWAPRKYETEKQFSSSCEHNAIRRAKIHKCRKLIKYITIFSSSWIYYIKELCNVSLLTDFVNISVQIILYMYI